MRYALAIALCATGCSGSTGSGLVTFAARAGGPADVTPGGPLEFESGSYHVSLTQASFHFGAIYLNKSVPVSGAPATPCVLPGVYVGQVFGACNESGVCGVDLDLLSPELTTFSVSGEGTADEARVAEVWLTSGDVNAATDLTPALIVAGTASRSGQMWPFRATVTISANRQLPVQNPAMPGSNPICKQRIVTPICLDVPEHNCRQKENQEVTGFILSNGGTLDLRVDPRPMFNSVDFAALTPEADGSYVIPDTLGGVGGVLFNGVKSRASYEQITYTAGQ
jgi:hypothetical protein